MARYMQKLFGSGLLIVIRTTRTAGQTDCTNRKRILDVLEDNVTLIESNGKSGQYVALSHCWGKEQFINTT
jgi:hypothetical protein